jgi:methionyl aminopeptidase
MTKKGDWKTVKNREEIELIRNSSRLVAKTLALLGSMIQPGVRTKDLDGAAEDFIRSNGGVPSFKGYRGFPASICASVNSEVVHGIPGERILRESDIVSIDVGVLKEGYHGDGAATFPVGRIIKAAVRLLDTTKQALMAGIGKARDGNRVRDISHAIQTVVEGAGYSVVRDYAGHGIGQLMHEQPQIPNFVGNDKSPMLVSGMTLAIEPMVNIGTSQVVTGEDGWTVVVKDETLSAHFEHTVVVGEETAEILTAA